MSGTAQAGMAVLALVYVAAWFLVRWAVTPTQPREHKPEPVEVWEPAYLWLPAEELATDCPGCGHHITFHTARGTA